MKNFFNIFILLYTTLFSLIGFGQDIQLKLKSEKITIQEDSSFINEITIVFKESDSPRIYPIFYDTELEQISNIQLFAIKGKRKKKIPVKNIIEENVELDYIASKKIKSVIIPAEKEIKLKYVSSCRQLMYFSGLHFFSYNDIDTLKYQINVPNKFKLVHNTIYKDTLSFHKIDSTITDYNSVWNIKVSPMKVKPDPLQFFGIYKNMKVPLTRTLGIKQKSWGID